MNDKEAFDLAKKYLSERVQMVVATQGEHPWIATVYYTFDDELNLYFLSNPETIHCKHIASNPQVAVAIADSPQNPASKKLGLQIFGLAEQITSENKIIHALKLWRSTLDVKSDAYTYEGMMKKLIKGRMYKITPKKMKFFNEAVWDEGDEPLIDL